MLRIILSLLIFLLSDTALSRAETKLVYPVPFGCHNNEGINADPTTFVVGPLYLQSCENVCEFDDEGRVLDRKTAWHVPTICGGPDNSTVVHVNCMADKRAPNCYLPVANEDDHRNHDCRRNVGGNWRCVYIRKTTRCEYPSPESPGGKKLYTEVVRIAECGISWQ